MWSFFLSALALAVRAQAQSVSTSALPTTTVTFTSTTTVYTATVTTAATATATSTVTLSAGGNSTSTSTTSSDSSVVTNQAYIDTVLRHHNQHRLNHSSPAVVWDSGLADIARRIATRCVFEEDLTEDCPTSDCYGQSPAAGYPSTEMGGLISEGFYNPQANNYIYYGEEPDVDTYSSWGYMTQIIWKATTSVGCYTADCSANGLDFPDDDGDGVPPYFTVCNYKGPGNYYGNFTVDVLPPTGLTTILGGYECRTYDNCVNGVTTGDERAGGDDENDSGTEEGGVIGSKKKMKVKRKAGQHS